MKKEIKVQGMHCKSCEMLLKDAIEEKGLKVIRIDHKSGTIEVEIEESEKINQAINAIESEGYKVV